MIKIIIAAITFYAGTLQNASATFIKLAEELKTIYSRLDDSIKGQLKLAIRLQLLAFIEFKRAYKMLPADIKLTAPSVEGMESLATEFVKEFDAGIDELAEEFSTEIEALSKA